MTRPKITEPALLFSLMCLMVLAILASIFLWDRLAVEYLQMQELTSIIPIAALLGGLASPIPYFVSSAVVLVLDRFHHPNRLTANRARFILLTSATADLSADILKVLFGRSRPDLYMHEHIDSFHPFENDQSFDSFPSEHAAIAGAIAAAFSVLMPNYRPTFVLLALMIAASRVAIGLHYPSDVLAGLLLGLVSGVVITSVFQRLKLNLHKSATIWDGGSTPGES